MARRPCNCGGRRRGGKQDGDGDKKQRYTLTTTGGRVMTFGSRLEADAERVRRGGGTVKRG